MTRPTCAKCGLEMTPQNAKLRPELFYHDACLPDEFRPKLNPTHLEIVCESGHRQLLKVDASLGLAWAEGLAGLLDGTSPMYLHPPRDESPIGKCGICGKKVKATILGHG